MYILDIFLWLHSNYNLLGEDNKEGKRKCDELDLLHHPEDCESKCLEEGEEDHPPGLHVLHIGNLGVLAQDQAKSHTVEEATPMYRKTPKRTRTGMRTWTRTGMRSSSTKIVQEC